MTGILTNFSGRDALLWGHQPLKVTHDLGDQALFSRAALARLIETYPREHYGLIAMGGTGDSKLWQEGDLGGASGEAVLDAIEKGRLWLNLRNVSGVNPAHGLLLDTIFSELRLRRSACGQAHCRSSGLRQTACGCRACRKTGTARQ
jgi:hypothetical protein